MISQKQSIVQNTMILIEYSWYQRGIWVLLGKQQKWSMIIRIVACNCPIVAAVGAGQGEDFKLLVLFKQQTTTIQFSIKQDKEKQWLVKLLINFLSRHQLIFHLSSNHIISLNHSEPRRQRGRSQTTTCPRLKRNLNETFRPTLMHRLLTPKPRN